MAITLIKRNVDIPARRESGYMSGTYTAATVTNSLLTVTNADANGFATYSSAGVLTQQRQNVVLAAGVATITLGFAPKRVFVQNVTQRISKEWLEGMNLTDSLLTVAAGTKTLVTTSGVLVSSPAPSATPGTQPVTLEPVPLVVITFATDSLVTDNDTWAWIIEG